MRIPRSTSRFWLDYCNLRVCYNDASIMVIRIHHCHSCLEAAISLGGSNIVTKQTCLNNEKTPSSGFTQCQKSYIRIKRKVCIRLAIEESGRLGTTAMFTRKVTTVCGNQFNAVNTLYYIAEQRRWICHIPKCWSPEESFNLQKMQTPNLNFDYGIATSRSGLGSLWD